MPQYPQIQENWVPPWHLKNFFKVQHMDVFTPCTDTHAMEYSPATASQAGGSPVEPIPSFCLSCQSVPPVRPSLLSTCPSSHGPTVPLQSCHAQVAVVTAPESLSKGVVLNFQLRYLQEKETKQKAFEKRSLGIFPP